MAPASVAGRLQVTPPIPGCGDLTAAYRAATATCRIVWRAGTRTLAIEHPGAPLEPRRHYSVALAAGVADLGGVTNGLDHRWAFTAAAPPALARASPGDGSGAVELDAPITLTFDSPMDVTSVEHAVRLAPMIDGTQVVANRDDPARYVLLPGRLLAPRSRYVLTVDASARNAHGAALEAPVAVSFTTGSRTGPGPRAVILEGMRVATSVVLARTADPAPGDPPAAVVVAQAPLCTAPSGCGAVAAGEPAESFTEAALSPDGSHLAVTVRDLVRGGIRVDLVTLDGTTPVATVAGDAYFPSWSPDGRSLAVAVAGTVDLLPAAGGQPVRLPGRSPLTGPARWSADSSTLALAVVGAAGVPTVELADPVLRIRYPAPGLSAGAASPALSPDATVLAAATGSGAAPTTVAVRLRTGDAVPKALATGLVPLAFRDGTTLLALETGAAHGSGSGLVRVSLAGGDLDPVPLPAAVGVAEAVAVSPSGLVGVVAVDSAGVRQAWVLNADGSNPVAMTAYPPGAAGVISLSLSG